ncbi:MAG: class I SAM-dependent methyltransferase [Rhodospirillaceae bacterium]|nr:class I SAM-dependent methyltransferase [Rhodospirillaceae bacterium]
MSGLIVEQYQALPYPARNPADEVNRLVEGSPSRLLEINHYIFSGARDFRGTFRALIAGGGTGDAAIMLAQHLRDRHCPAELVYLDLSTTSRSIAESRAARRGLNNINFITGSLLDLPDLVTGGFDYIDCCGVLHHLDDPAAGLRTLAAALLPGGGMGVMVYGTYGRTGVYHAQAMLRLLAGQDNDRAKTVPARLDLARRLLQQLPSTNWLRRNPAIADHVHGGDAGLYDLLLHSTDRAYDVPGFVELVTGCGLEIATFIDPWRYDPASYIKDPVLLSQLADLTPMERAGFAELLAGNLKCHVAYLVPQGMAAASVARPTCSTAIPVLRPDALSWANRIGARESLTLTIDGLKTSIALPPFSAPIMALIDGQRSIAAIHQEMARASEEWSDWIKFKPVFDKVYTMFNSLNVLFLEQPRNT